MSPTAKASDETFEPPRVLFARNARPSRRRLGQPRLLIVGCGDIGIRIVARLRDRFRIFGTVANPANADAVRANGAVPMLLDLDQGNASSRIRAVARRVIILAPTSPQGSRDMRARRLLRLLGHAAGARMLYLSTSGVYGNRNGAWTDESTPPMPVSERAQRRLDAELLLRASSWHAAVLRVPGIYGPERLPIDRLRRAVPVPLAGQDVITNHIHADDLTRACIAALFRAAPTRIYNVVDDSQLYLGQYLDRVADSMGLPHPPRVSWDELRAAAGEQRMSFLGESRRLQNVRMKRELRVRLQFPDVDAGLTAMGRQSSSG
ncbi:MAG TPA: NAD-dependent epimerase/dehydratase family protein [Burkholderiaceae bacterium]|nr:NAD-dependent epimerase/dehydratase family protein [Burkholderiaceae bacterium]